MHPWSTRSVFRPQEYFWYTRGSKRSSTVLFSEFKSQGTFQFSLFEFYEPGSNREEDDRLFGLLVC